MPAPAPARVSVLPPALAAFATAAVVLQWQPELPMAATPLAAAAIVVALAIGMRALARDGPGSRVAIATLVALSAGLLAFGYATWRAQVRLDDALPSEWEGVDIVLVGVIDDLPQTSARGTRFAFAVERGETPGAVGPNRLSPAWY